MSEEELIQTLKEFENKRVEKLPETSRQLFYAIMKIADERDKLQQENKELKEINEEHKKLNGELREEIKQLKERINYER